MIELFLEWLYVTVGIDTTTLDKWYEQAQWTLRHGDNDILLSFVEWYKANIGDEPLD